MYVMIYFSNLLIIFTDTSPVGAIVGGTIGGIILLCILFTAIPLCISYCMSAGKKSSYNQSIGLASTVVHPPQTADARLVAETKFTQQQVPPPSEFGYTSAYPATGYIQQPLPPPTAIDQPLGPPPAYPATEYELVAQQPSAQMGYPPVGYPVQCYGYPAPVGYPVQSYEYPQMEDPRN